MRNPWWLFGLVACLALCVCGCANPYVITLNNGRRIDAPHKPKLEGANYVYKDAQGQKVYIPAGRVREIAPASMAEATGSQFKVSPAR